MHNLNRLTLSMVGLLFLIAMRTLQIALLLTCALLIFLIILHEKTQLLLRKTTQIKEFI